MRAPRRDAEVRVQRDLYITIPGPVTGDQARKMVAAYLAGGDPDPSWVIDELPPSIPAICWMDTPNQIEVTP